MNSPQVGTAEGIKINTLYLEQPGQDNGPDDGAVSPKNPVLKKLSTEKKSLNLADLGQAPVAEPMNNTADSYHLSVDHDRDAKKLSLNNLNTQPKPMADVAPLINQEQWRQWQQLTQHRFQGPGVDIGLVVPQGIDQSQLNAFEEMLYAFKRRVAQEYINKLLLTYGDYQTRYPQEQFPWSDRPQQVRAKLIFNHQGELLRVDVLKKSQLKKLDQFFKDTMHAISKLPNPPTLMFNTEGEFEIIFGLDIVMR